MKRKTMEKKEQGITLVALVVTIVVLLILAGISLNLVLGENGIITKAKEAKNAALEDKDNTEKALDHLTDEMLEYLDEDVSLGKVSVNEKASKNSTINGEEPSETNPIIPKGYIAINTDTTSWGDGTSSPTEENINKGLVITDDNGNEWVWVPVEDASVMYETSDTPLTLLGSTGVTTTKYSKSEIISGVTRGKSGELNDLPQEPDLLGEDNDSYAEIAGFNNLTDMATNLVSDYETMIASIEKYHGFYIGRYELTANGEKPGETLTNKNWYQLYANCKGLAANDKTITRMIWGCQWDVTCNWLANSGYDIENSIAWGNYENYNTANNYLEENDKYETGAGSKQMTGSSENWKANNIYDLAGNCLEWTQENADDDADRASRGGFYQESNIDFTNVSIINSCNSPSSEEEFMRNEGSPNDCSIG